MCNPSDLTKASRNLKYSISVIILAYFLMPLATAQDFQTSFEQITQGPGSFALGTPPNSVTFEGGESKTVGNPALYRTGLFAFMVRGGNTATITFETPGDVTLFFKDQDSSVASVLTFLDANGQVVATFQGSVSGPDGNGFTRVQVTDSLVKTITLRNNASASPPYAVIDDLSFTASAAQTFTNQLFFAQFADGGDASARITSQITLVNPSSTAAVNSEVEILDGAGNAITVDLNGEMAAATKSFQIQPSGAAVFSTDGEGVFQVGSVRVNSDAPLFGVVLFAGVGSSGIGVAGVGSSEPLQSFLAPMETDLANNLQTGIAQTRSSWSWWSWC